MLDLLSDLVAAPDKNGAMENWGLVLYREDVMLFDPAKDSATEQKTRATVIGHEIAHQVASDENVESRDLSFFIYNRDCYKMRPANLNFDLT